MDTNINAKDIGHCRAVSLHQPFVVPEESRNGIAFLHLLLINLAAVG